MPNDPKATTNSPGWGVVNRWCDVYKNDGTIGVLRVRSDPVLHFLAKYIDDAVAAERERCTTELRDALSILVRAHIERPEDAEWSVQMPSGLPFWCISSLQYAEAWGVVLAYLKEIRKE